jgi:hypothetical protein
VQAIWADGCAASAANTAYLGLKYRLDDPAYCEASPDAVVDRARRDLESPSELSTGWNLGLIISCHELSRRTTEWLSGTAHVDIIKLTRSMNAKPQT